MSAALLAEAPVIPGCEGGSTDVVQTRLLPVARTAAWRAWTTPAVRAIWWGDSPEIDVIEAVEPVWLVFRSTTLAPGGRRLEQTASVTFVQLGDQTHIALHSETATQRSAADADSSAAVWRKRLSDLNAGLAAE